MERGLRHQHITVKKQEEEEKKLLRMFMRQRIELSVSKCHWMESTVVRDKTWFSTDTFNKENSVMHLSRLDYVSIL
jgi:hypothetical protein